jgi:uncharacterized protein
VEAYYYSFNDYLKNKFGERVHRISLNAGFTCPNKDGTLDNEGCIFCNEEGFSHITKNVPNIQKQIEDGIKFSKDRFKAKKFIAYFQNATNTNASVGELKKAYDSIKLFPEIVGLFISTRPDSIDYEKLNLIKSYSDDYDVWMEYGVQTSNDKTLNILNRKHTFSQSKDAIEKTKKKNIKVAAHVILGLPGETKEDMLTTAESLRELSIDGIKFHVLHVLKDTKLNDLFNSKKVKILEKEEYIGLVCDFLEIMKPDCVVMRLASDANKDILVHPQWINEKQKVIEGIKQEFKRRNTKQGSKHA